MLLKTVIWLPGMAEICDKHLTFETGALVQRIYLCMYVHTYVHTYVHMYAHMYVHI
jgi:hypothetical protein